MPSHKTLEQRIAASLPLSLYQALAPRQVIGFVYHLVSPDPPPHIRHIYPSKTPQEFEQDLIYLKEHFSPVSYEQLLDHTAGRSQLKPRACLLTIDDGYADCFSYARPLLLEHGAPCIFFLTTDFFDNRRLFYRNKYSLCVEAINQRSDASVREFLASVNRIHGQSLESRQTALTWLRDLKPDEEAILDWVCNLLNVDEAAILQTARPFLTSEEVQQLVADGFTIGAHSKSHTKFNLLSQEEIEVEILGSCQDVMALTGQERVPFAFPFSGAGVDRRFLSGLVEQYAFLDFFFDSQGVRKDAPCIINRVWADPPPEDPNGGSNLGELLHAAYQENALWRRAYYASMVREYGLLHPLRTRRS